MSNYEVKNHQLIETKEQSLLGYIPFDPEKELKIVAKITDPELKKKSLEAYKKELFAQKIGIAKLMIDLEKLMLESPDLEADKFKEIAKKKAPELKMTQGQLNYFNRVIERFVKQHQIVKKYQEQMISGLEIFHKKTGQWPEGEIEIEFKPITINLQFKNIKDYTLYVFGEINRQLLKEASQEDATLMIYGGLNDLKSGIVAVSPNNKEEGTIIHEETHALKTLFDQTFNIEEQRFFKKELDRAIAFRNNQAVEQNLNSYFRCEADDYIDDLAEEILAFYREGKDIKYIKKQLSDYYFPKIEREIKSNFKQWKKVLGDYGYLTKKVQNEMQSRMNDKIDEIFKAIKILESANYSRQEIIALLVTESPGKWLKWAYRLTSL